MPRTYNLRRPSAAELVGDPLLAAIDRFVAGAPDQAWCGTPHELFAELNKHATEAVRRQADFWPTSPLGLTRRLGYLSAGLTARGLVVNRRKLFRASLCITRAAADAA